MADINIQQVPDAPGGYDLTGKKVMVHDQSAPISTSTVMVLATDLGSGGGVSGGYAAPIYAVDGTLGMPEQGATSFTDPTLIGATQMNFIIVNKMIEFISEDYVFDNTTGELIRNNEYALGDKMVLPHKPA